MKILCENHPYHYEIECLAMLFYPGEKMVVHTTGSGTADDAASQPDTLPVSGGAVARRTTPGPAGAAAQRRDIPVQRKPSAGPGIPPGTDTPAAQPDAVPGPDTAGYGGPETDQLYTGIVLQGNLAELTVRAVTGGVTREASDRVVLPEGMLTRECERRLGVLCYRLLSEATGCTPSWGILTGVRPVKLFIQALDRGLEEQEIAGQFSRDYLISEQKIGLALETARHERAILAQSRPESFSLYVSVPFCPSRCRYCSFVSHSVEQAARLLPDYVEKLCEEIAFTGSIARELGLQLETVYIGGGTPTTLSAGQLSRVMDAVGRSFELKTAREYTVEAGRPDTITPEKLAAIREGGATRISINPQTMDDRVLGEIGRRHTAKETEEAYRLARELGFGNINMDLIAGLPTDSYEGFRRSLDRVLELRPENVTVHSLSVKRASRMAGKTLAEFRAEYETVSRMIDYSQQALGMAGYHPYYLYRQKNTAGNLENTGYALDGYDCGYNVYIMDETHTILAVGGGAVTKLRQPGGGLIQRIFNFKYPYEYIARFDQILDRKRQVSIFYEKNRPVPLRTASDR